MYLKGKELNNIITLGYGNNTEQKGITRYFHIQVQRISFKVVDVREKFEIDILKLKFKIKVLNG